MTNERTIPMPALKLVSDHTGPRTGDDVLSGQRFRFNLRTSAGWDVASEWSKLMTQRWGITFRSGAGDTVVVKPEGLIIPEPEPEPDDTTSIVCVAGPVLRVQALDCRFYAECVRCSDVSKRYIRRNEWQLLRWARNHRCQREEVA